MDDVSYSPRILCSIEEIKKTFHVGRERVYDWIDAGAPISAIRRKGRTYYTCELMRLVHWLETYSSK